MMKRTLIIYGAFGQQRLRQEIRDWSHTVVVEVDARLPLNLRQKGAEVISTTVLNEPEAAEKTTLRAQELLDAFLEDTFQVSGLNTSREFRSACLSLAGMRLVVPYVRTLMEASEIMRRGSWERIVISPGTGVCLRAWQQVGKHFNVPVTLLSMDRKTPPALWMLRRRFHRWRLSKIKGQNRSSAPFRLPNAVVGDVQICVDPRMVPILGEVGARAGWRAAPRLIADSEEVEQALRVRYLAWWKGWWAGWTEKHLQLGGLSDHEALCCLGDLMANEVYPKHACALEQARRHLAVLKPRRILLGTTLGSVEIMWVLAARELNIQVVAYTLDDPIHPRLCFVPDILIVDDQKHERLARERGFEDQLIYVRTHRQMPSPSAVASSFKASQRPLVLFAASFYLGHVPTAVSEVTLWSIELMVDAARQLPEVDFAIKFHPVRERPDSRFNWDGFHHLHLWQAHRHFQSLKPTANVCLIMPEIRLNDILSSVSVLLHLDSYAALEACSAEVPVICLSPTKNPLGANLSVIRDFGALKLAGNSFELVSELKALLLNCETRMEQIRLQQKFLANFYPKNAPSLVEALPL